MKQRPTKRLSRVRWMSWTARRRSGMNLAAGAMEVGSSPPHREGSSSKICDDDQRASGDTKKPSLREIKKRNSDLEAQQGRGSKMPPRPRVRPSLGRRSSSANKARTSSIMGMILGEDDTNRESLELERWIEDLLSMLIQGATKTAMLLWCAPPRALVRVEWPCPRG